LARWKITGVTPYVVGARPDPALITREQAEREARLAEETERLKRRYSSSDAQQALARHAEAAETELAEIDKATKVPPTPFLKAPPMTLDDELRFESVRLAHGVPLVASRFDSMTGATTGLALRLDAVPAEELRYVSLLPELLTRAGVIENGQPIPYEQMSERLPREILALNATFPSNPRTGRVEHSHHHSLDVEAPVRDLRDHEVRVVAVGGRDKGIRPLDSAGEQGVDLERGALGELTPALLPAVSLAPVEQRDRLGDLVEHGDLMALFKH
jgi:hypothetical protein